MNILSNDKGYEMPPLFGHKMKFKQAGRPSNVIWENKGITSFQKLLNYGKWSIFVIVLSIITFGTITFLKI